MMRRISPRAAALLSTALGVVILACLAMGLLRPSVATSVFQHTLDATRNAGPAGYVVFATLMLVVAASGILPASLLGIAAGTAYGLPLGFLLAAVGTMAGATVSFALSRSLFRDAIARRLARRPEFSRFDELLAQNGWRIVCLLRISPVMPFAATSYALGMSAVGIEAYLIGTAASLPALAGYVYLGTLADAGLSAWTTGAAPLRWAMLGLGGLATVALTVVGYRIGRRALGAESYATTPP
jgi:uncharacterized membrane protein YdjX (TVP38/TMEM64 family)